MKGCARKRVRSESTREKEKDLELRGKTWFLFLCLLPACYTVPLSFQSNSELEVVWVESGDRSPFSFTLLLYRGMLGMKEMLEDR
jgi:hypothetical protein